MPNTPIIEIKNISKTFTVGTQSINILKKVSFEVFFKDFLVIVGPSGCGKSTLLHSILGLEDPTEGEVIFLNESLYNNTTEDYRSNFRKHHVGMIYQQPNWIKSMNVVENVAFPLLLLGFEKEAAMTKALDYLRQVELEAWAHYHPTELSGGQQQRVALARGLVNNPKIIIADEPTGNLDFQAGQTMMELLSKLNKDEGITIIMVTHDLEYLRYANRAVKMLDGTVTEILNEDNIHTLWTDVKSKRGS